MWRDLAQSEFGTNTWNKEVPTRRELIFENMRTFFLKWCAFVYTKTISSVVPLCPLGPFLTSLGPFGPFFRLGWFCTFGTFLRIWSCAVIRGFDPMKKYVAVSYTTFFYLFTCQPPNPLTICRFSMILGFPYCRLSPLFPFFI